MPRAKHLVTPHFGWEYPELGAEADVPTDLHELLLQIENNLHLLPLEELAHGAAKQIMVVQGTGAAAYKALSGDATIAETGAMTIINEAINTVKIAALAVTQAKIAGEAVSTAQLAALGVTEAKLAALAVSTAKIANAAVTDEKLASPNTPMMREILRANNIFISEKAAATYMMTPNGSVEPPESGSNTLASNQLPALLYFESANYAVANKTTKMKLACQLATNATAITSQMNFSLRALAVTGAANELRYTAGAEVAGSKLEVVFPEASKVGPHLTADFAVPANGAYILVCELVSKFNLNAKCSINAQILVHNV